MTELSPLWVALLLLIGLGDRGIAGSDFGPEIGYADGHSSSSSSVTPDKCRDRTLNQATTASFHTVASDTVQSETAVGVIVE